MVAPRRKAPARRNASSSKPSRSSGSVASKEKGKALDPKKVVTGVCRSTFMKVTELTAGKGGKDGQASTGILIPKSDKKTVAKIKRAIDFAAKEKFGETCNIFKSQKLKNPLKDGDELLEDPDCKMGEEIEDHYFLNAKTYRLPKVCNRQGRVVEDREEIIELCMSGFYFHFTLWFNGYDATTEDGVKIKGVNCMLNNLMFKKKGEVLGGGGGDPEADFAEFAEDEDEGEYEDEEFED